MQLFFRGNSTHVLECEEHDTIVSLRARIAALENLEPTDLNLYCEGSPVNDESRASEFKLSIIEYNVGLLGGKVHGSLARAGKVRAQTPKVEKQEKKKKKTGRAKKRMQYNKRILNARNTFGRRVGPNSNS